MCIFCKIAKHEIPADVLYEDDFVMAFLDIQPVSQGHALIISKKHHVDFAHTPSDVFARMHAIATRLSKHYEYVLNVTDFNLLSNLGVKAGQSVFHVHLHLIPRYGSQDGLHLEFHHDAKHIVDSQLKELLKLKK